MHAWYVVKVLNHFGILRIGNKLMQVAVVVLQPEQIVVELQPALVELQVVVEQLWGAEVL